jgi:thiol:disulfide interchange protein
MRRIVPTVPIRLASWVAGGLLLLVLGGRATAASKPPATAKMIDFKVSIRPSDPFSEENQVGAKLKPIQRGTTFTLMITGKPKPGYHTYPMTQRSSDDAAQPEIDLTHVVYESAPGLMPLWPVTETPAPQMVAEPGIGVLLEYEHPFTWMQEILVLPDAKPGQLTLAFDVSLTVCDVHHCTPGKHHLTVPLQVSDAKALPLSAAIQKKLETKPQIAVIPVPASLEGKTSQFVRDDQENVSPGGAARPQNAGVSGTKKAGTGWLALLLASILSGAGMLLTPCVFPMIPITVSFFLKQSEKKNHKPLLSAGLYSGTIIVVLAGSVLLLSNYIGSVADSPWTNLGLGVLLVFFALSLFGMYEIELPHFLSRFTSTREGQGGYAGTVFMALTFTITSFTCTGPFLGPLLATTASARYTLAQLTVASVSYAATFAAPFFFLALFPSLIKKLPKSGGWLNSVKVVMGFLEMAAALKFLSNVDVSWHPGNPWFFTYETVLIAWIVLSVACGLYLLGLYRLPHDTPVEHIGVTRMLLATLFLGLAVYMTPALSRKIPQGVVGEQIVKLLPLDTSEQVGKSSPAGGTERLTWYRSYEEAWKKANEEGKDLFIDFTGVNCPNCRANETTVFPRPQVRDRLQKFIRVQLYTDSVPNPNLSKEQAQALGQRNMELQNKTFDDISRPLYVILRPAKDEPFADGKLKGQIINRLGGSQDVDTFVKFLDSSLPRGEVAQSN